MARAQHLARLPARAGSGRSPSRSRPADCPRKPGPGSPFQASATICRRVRSCCSCLAAASSRSLSISACSMPCASLASRCGTMRAPSSAAWTNRPPPSFCNRPASRRPGPGPARAREAALEIVQEKLAQGCKLVQKPLFGAQGEGLRLISAPDDLAPPEEVNGAYYLQEFIASADGMHRDWRHLRLSRPRRRVHDQARFELDHQYQARRPRRGRHPLARACRSCSPRRVLRRRRLCRGRHHPGPLGRASRARGELDAGVAGVAAGHADPHRRLYRGAVP